MAEATSNTGNPPQEGDCFSPSRAEFLLAFCVASLFLGVHLLTYNHYPASWCDEVTYCEPGINLAQGRGLTTQIWQFQPANTFWAVNPPLYPVLLAGWIKIFSPSLLGVRSLNFTLFTAAALLLWTIAWRHQIVSRPAVRLGLIVLAHCGYGLSLAFRSARPDVVPMAALLLLCLAMSWRPSPLRAAVAGVLAFLIPFMGLQIALYLAIVATLACALGHLSRPMLVWLGIWSAIGAGGLFALLFWQDAWHHFRASVEAVTQAGGIRGAVSAAKVYAKDLSGVPLLLACGVLYLKLARRRKYFRPAAALALLIYTVVPLVFCVTADFRAYYAYMIFFPLLLTFGHLACLAREKAIITPLKWPQWMAVAAAITSAVVGLPLRLALTHLCADLTPRRELAQKVAAVLGSRDIVFTEYFTFFEVKAITSNVWVPFSAKGLGHIEGPGRELTPIERDSTTVIITRPESRAHITAYFGGQWMPVASPFGDELHRPPWMSQGAFSFLRKVVFERAPTARYRVEVLRRTNAPPAPK